MLTIEILQAELAKNKNVLAVNMAKRQEICELLNSADTHIAKIKGRIELLNEQIRYCSKQTE